MSIARCTTMIATAASGILAVGLAALAPSSAVTTSGNIVKTPAPKTSTSPSVYVATNGVDAPGKGSATSPYRTIQYAVSSVAPGWAVQVAAGSYAPFVVTTSNVTVVGASRTTVIIRGTAGVQGVVTLAGTGDQLSNLTVTGCRPNPTPPSSFEFSGSASVLVKKTATNAVVSNLNITNGTGINTYGLPFGCFGVYLGEDTGVVVIGNDISGQGDGVFVFKNGNNDQITSNTIHDNNVEIRNTTLKNDDFGGTAVGLFETFGSPGPLVQGNTMFNNIAPSYDYVTDGGAFEVFQASNVTMSNNTIYNNENVLETGAGSATYPCANNVFTNNVVSGLSAGSTLVRSVGMILRCAANMQITNNTFSKLDWYTFDIEQSGSWSGAITNLTITGNRITQTTHVVYAMMVDPHAYGMVVNANQYTFAGSIAKNWLNQLTPTLAAWQTLTGLDSRSSQIAR